jgi:hypothetical protein
LGDVGGPSGIVDRNLNAVSLIRATLEPSGGGDAIRTRSGHSAD